MFDVIIDTSKIPCEDTLRNTLRKHENGAARPDRFTRRRRAHCFGRVFRFAEVIQAGKRRYDGMMCGTQQPSPAPQARFRGRWPARRQTGGLTVSPARRNCRRWQSQIDQRGTASGPEEVVSPCGFADLYAFPRENRPLPSFPEQCRHFPGNPPSLEPQACACWRRLLAAVTNPFLCAWFLVTAQSPSSQSGEATRS